MRAGSRPFVLVTRPMAKIAAGAAGSAVRGDPTGIPYPGGRWGVFADALEPWVRSGTAAQRKVGRIDVPRFPR